MDELKVVLVCAGMGTGFWRFCCKAATAPPPTRAPTAKHAARIIEELGMVDQKGARTVLLGNFFDNIIVHVHFMRRVYLALLAHK